MSFEDIEQEVLKWHRETFPRATEEAVARKVNEELQEFIDVVINPDQYDKRDYWNELADVIISNMAYIAKTGEGVSLADIIRLKLDVNKSRKWGAELEDGSRERAK